MKYSIIQNTENSLFTFRVDSGPNAGSAFSIKDIKDNGETDVLDVDYLLVGWPRGILMPTESECEEIINFVICDVLKEILNLEDKEKNESI